MLPARTLPPACRNQRSPSHAPISRCTVAIGYAFHMDFASPGWTWLACHLQVVYADITTGPGRLDTVPTYRVHTQPARSTEHAVRRVVERWPGDRSGARHRWHLGCGDTGRTRCGGAGSDPARQRQRSPGRVRQTRVTWPHRHPRPRVSVRHWPL